MGEGLEETDIILAARDAGVRIGAVYDEKIQSYDLTIEGDVLLGGPDTDLTRVGWLLGEVTQVADRLEERLLGGDQPMPTFRDDLALEVSHER